MNPNQLKNINYSAMQIIANNIVNGNDEYVLKKLHKIDKYLEIRLDLKPNLEYSELLHNSEFSEYISQLWQPASFMGWYNLDLSIDDKKVIDEYQNLIRTISRFTVK